MSRQQKRIDKRLKGAPSGGTVVAELAHWCGEAERLAGVVSDLKRRVRLARRAIAKSPLTAWRDAYRLLDLRRRPVKASQR